MATGQAPICVPGYLPFAQSGGQLGRRENSRPDCFLILLHPSGQQALRADLRHRHHQPGIRGVAGRLRRREDDHRAARSPHPPLRHRRNRQRQLAHQNTSLNAFETQARVGCASWKATPPRACSPQRRRGPFWTPVGGTIQRRLTDRPRSAAAWPNWSQRRRGSPSVRHRSPAHRRMPWQRGSARAA